jgi:hypothetical protein
VVWCFDYPDVAYAKLSPQRGLAIPEGGRLGMHWAEKRERDRIALSLPIEYYRIDSDLYLTENLHRGYTVNASENGLMVISRDEILMDSDVRIKLFYCFPDLKCVEALSHVIWDVKREKERDYLAGMKIVGADLEDLRRWEQFLDALCGLKPC